MRRTKANSTYKKLADQCSADRFVVNQKLVLLINIYGKNRQLFIAPKRYCSHSKRFILFERTNLDIQTVLIKAGNKISEVVDITTLLNIYMGVPLSGRALRSNLLPFGTKGFPMQLLTQIAA